MGLLDIFWPTTGPALDARSTARAADAARLQKRTKQKAHTERALATSAMAAANRKDRINTKKAKVAAKKAKVAKAKAKAGKNTSWF